MNEVFKVFAEMVRQLTRLANRLAPDNVRTIKVSFNPNNPNAQPGALHTVHLNGPINAISASIQHGVINLWFNETPSQPTGSWPVADFLFGPMPSPQFQPSPRIDNNYVTFGVSPDSAQAAQGTIFLHYY